MIFLEAEWVILPDMGFRGVHKKKASKVCLYLGSSPDAIGRPC